MPNNAGDARDVGAAVVVEVEALSKRYGAAVAVADVSFTVAEGEIFGILGPNGAGKTTIVECVQGLRRPDVGRVRILGLDPHRDRVELRRLFGGIALQEDEGCKKLRFRFEGDAGGVEAAAIAAG